MESFIMLFLTFLFSLVGLRFWRKRYHIALSARIALSKLLLFIAIAHFVFTDGLVMTLPEFIPLKRPLVYAVGGLEFIAAFGIHYPRYQMLSGWFLLVLFILILPLNIHSAIQHIDLKAATYDGKGPAFLLVRIPIQLVIIIWTYLSVIRTKQMSRLKDKV